MPSACIHVFACLLCHRWPRLEPRECEITSTRGISRLYRAEKIYLCQKTRPIFIPTNFVCLPLLAAYLLPNPQHTPTHPQTIKLHHYIWVPTGMVCPGLLMLHPQPVLSPLSMAHGGSLGRTNSPVSFFWGGGVGRHGDTKINARFPMST